MTPLPGEVELDLVRKLGKGPGPFDLADDLKVLVYPFEVEGHLHGTSWSPCQYPSTCSRGERRGVEKERRGPVWAMGPRLERVLRHGAGWEAIRSHLGSYERALGMTWRSCFPLAGIVHRSER